MKSERVLEAGAVLGWLAEQAGAFPEPSDEAAAMALHLTLANMYLTEYAAHLSKGLEPYDALRETLSGTLALSQRQRDVTRALMPPKA